MWLDNGAGLRLGSLKRLMKKGIIGDLLKFVKICEEWFIAGHALMRRCVGIFGVLCWDDGLTWENLGEMGNFLIGNGWWLGGLRQPEMGVGKIKNGCGAVWAFL